MPKARSDNIGHLKSVFQEPEPDDTVVKEKKKINRNPPFRREGNLGWEPVSVLLNLLTNRVHVSEKCLEIVRNFTTLDKYLVVNSKYQEINFFLSRSFGLL